MHRIEKRAINSRWEWQGYGYLAKLIPMIAIIFRSLIFVSLFATSTHAPTLGAQELPEYDPDDVEVSYIYAALMGTGSYKIDGRRITMLRMPFSWTQRKMTETEAGFKWSMPVVIGHDKVEGSDWFEALFPDDLVTLSVLPGFEYQMPLTSTWVIKPFGNLGYTQDFVTDQGIVLGVLGLSSVALYHLDEEQDWELRWGNKVRFAWEHQLESGSETSFGIFETGLDIRRGLGFQVFDHDIDLGGYYRFQHFMPEWNFSEAPDLHSDIENIHELGFSVGLQKPKKIFGITFNRVRVGYKTGGDIRGFTIGGEFPF
jgi:hypothetical protein